jgi:superfamily II DNA or RNA helicase
MSSGLPTWEWKRRYESPPDNLIDSFYVPAFARSTIYDRAVGFFSSALLAQIAPSIDDFVLRGGRMRLMTSPANLSDADLLAMGKGEDIRERLKADLAAAVAAPVPSELLRDRLSLLTWMIATGRLDVRIALRELPTSFALFHEKIGVFEDDDGNWMTFTGSPNETSAAALKHSESFPLHRSWLNEDQRSYADDERRRFNALWDEEIDGVRIWSANEWIKDPMRQAFGIREPSAHTVVPKPPDDGDEPDLTDLAFNDLTLLPALPADLELREYQKDAINAWLSGDPNGHGVFAMATGVGKTITAMASATRLVGLVERTNRPLLVVVVVPLVDLVHQWKRDAEWFGWRPAVCHGDMNAVERAHLKEVFTSARASAGRRAEMVITTAASLTPRMTASGPDPDHFLQRQLARHTGFLLVIGDEMHSLGTPARLAALPAHATFRLGLSATPKRHGDEEGTDALLAYFGRPVVSVGIKDAIYKYGALVEYDYRPVRIGLTEEELKEYRILSRRIAGAFGGGDEEALERLIRQRTRLTQHASGKLGELRLLMGRGLAQRSHQIIYVAEGKNPDTEINQLAEVERILTDEHGMRVARYYGETEAEERLGLQRQLAEGNIDALIAMKCLDEGVDIPAARVGVMMASTQNPRQFVQRRGRLLRLHPASGKTHAEIFDFIVLPPPDPEGISESEKTLVGAELSRAVELADAARNTEVRYDVIEWAYEYDLDPERFTWMTLEAGDDMEAWTE